MSDFIKRWAELEDINDHGNPGEVIVANAQLGAMLVGNSKALRLVVEVAKDSAEATDTLLQACSELPDRSEVEDCMDSAREPLMDLLQALADLEQPDE